MRASLERPVLVLEDSDEDFETVEEAAKGAGLRNRLCRATSGEACLDLLQGHREPPLRPSVLLLDLNTPGMDGRDALVAIRADPALRDLPIVVLSTSANPRDLAHCYGNGANAYHLKPVRYIEHLQLLREVLSYWLTTVVLPGGSRSAV